MCKFHKDVAIQVATGSDGVIDPVRYGVMMCALSRYWIDLYMPEVDYLDGYSTYEMATSKAVAAMKGSPVIHELSQNIPAITAYAEEKSYQLRQSVDEVIAEQGLTLKSLHLPRRPLNNLNAISEIASGIYEGIPANGLNVKETVENPDHEPMRRAVSALFSKEEFEPVLRNMIAGSFARLMTEAQETVNPKLLNAYEALPYGFRTSFASCAMHGSGGTIGTHALCLLMPAAVGAVGMAASPVIAVGIDRALDWRQGNSFSWRRSASVAVVSLAVAFGINAAWPHDHLNTAQARQFGEKDKGTQDAVLATYRKEYDSLSDELRRRVDEQAAKRTISPEMYLAICDGSDSLGREIAEFQKQQKGSAEASFTARLVKSLGL
jgi:hypothetical protein